MKVSSPPPPPLPPLPPLPLPPPGGPPPAESDRGRNPTVGTESPVAVGGLGGLGGLDGVAGTELPGASELAGTLIGCWGPEVGTGRWMIGATVPIIVLPFVSWLIGF